MKEREIEMESQWPEGSPVNREGHIEVWKDILTESGMLENVSVVISVWEVCLCVEVSLDEQEEL